MKEVVLTQQGMCNGQSLLHHQQLKTPRVNEVCCCLLMDKHHTLKLSIQAIKEFSIKHSIHLRPARAIRHAHSHRKCAC